eukprot:TRINITY_DN1172_c0_g1_i1.p1 TRINITY_DN1172_c0_g1~~TRINITY_DN1172_c0_g1_i1.p1  ORF type:complete len:582 (-),score=164.15 TRINITY_DN1172_c0_g1_i1:168-1913(-)
MEKAAAEKAEEAADRAERRRRRASMPESLPGRRSSRRPSLGGGATRRRLSAADNRLLMRMMCADGDCSDAFWSAESGSMVSFASCDGSGDTTPRARDAGDNPLTLQSPIIESPDGAGAGYKKTGSGSKRGSLTTTRRLSYSAGRRFDMGEDSDEYEEGDDAWDGFEHRWRSSDGSPLSPEMYNLVASDDEDAFCPDPEDPAGIEKLFSFDMQRAAEALRNGASVEELAHIFEEGLEQTLGTRLGQLLEAASSKETESVEGLMTPPVRSGAATPTKVSGSPAAEMGDVSGLMTPTAEEAKTPLTAERLQAHLQSTLSASPPQKRQSIAMGHATLASAVRRASTHFRRSLCAAASMSPEKDNKVRQSIAQRSRRMSATYWKAAEVLVAAGIVGTDDAGDGAAEASMTPEKASPGAPEETALSPECAIDASLEKVHQAMEVARRRHRQSLCEAIQKVTEREEDECAAENSAGDEQSEFDAGDHREEVVKGKGTKKLPCQEFSQDRIDALVASFYAKHQERREQRGARRKGRGVAGPGTGAPAVVALLNARVQDGGPKGPIVHVGAAPEHGKLVSRTRRRGFAGA